MSIGIQVWSQTASQNSTIDTNINWPEGMAPSQVNDSARALMASAAKWRDDNNGTIVTSGSTTAYTVTTSQVEAALTAGYTVAFQMHATNDSSATLAVDGLAAKPLQVITGTNLQGGELQIGNIYRATYSSTGTGQWIVNDVVQPGSQANIIGTVNIAANAVTYAKLPAQVNNTLIANTSGSSGAPSAVTPSTLFDSTFGSTQGNILYRSSANWAALNAGTAGQFLQTQGNAANPLWASVGSALVNTYTPSNAASVVSSDFSATYSAYDVIFESVVASSAACTAQFQYQISGATQSSSYLGATWLFDSAGTSAANNSSTFLQISGSATMSTDASGLNGTIRIYNPSAAGTGKLATGAFSHFTSGARANALVGHGMWKGAAAVTGFVFSFSSGNIASGTIKVYGIV